MLTRSDIDIATRLLRGSDAVKVARQIKYAGERKNFFFRSVAKCKEFNSAKRVRHNQHLIGRSIANYIQKWKPKIEVYSVIITCSVH